MHEPEDEDEASLEPTVNAESDSGSDVATCVRDAPPPAAASAERTPEQTRVALRRKVRLFYDLQRMRIQCAARTTAKAPGAEVQLHEVDIAILEHRAKGLRRAEREALHDVEAHLRTMRPYTELLSDRVRFRGLGPTMAAVIL